MLTWRSSTSRRASRRRRWTAGRDDFDNWAICDRALLPPVRDRTRRTHGRRSSQWSSPPRRSSSRRARFALLASVALHDKETPDARFVRALPLIERAASDDRNFVEDKR
jgi:3-methyladenine DNA glycosylase AlkD